MTLLPAAAPTSYSHGHGELELREARFGTGWDRVWVFVGRVFDREGARPDFVCENGRQMLVCFGATSRRRP